MYNVEVKTDSDDDKDKIFETLSWNYQAVKPADADITNWINIYEVGNTFSSGEYARYVEKLSFENYIEIIGDYAFQNYSNLKILELPERLKEIGAGAFKNNTSLTSVTIPATVDGITVTSIGENVFEAGAESSSVYAVVISEGITTIGDYAFMNGLKLTHVSFPNSLTTIGRSAFEACALIGDLEFSENVKDIGMMVFKGNNGLTSATILNKNCLIKASAFPRALKTFTLYGYYGSTAASFAERNSLTFVSLDGVPETTPDPSEPAPEPGDNVQDPINPPDDIGGGSDTITYIQQSDITMVLIIVIAMLMFMMLFGGVLILFIIIKGKRQYDEMNAE